MIAVLDASVALKWVLIEPGTPKARQLRGEARRQAREFIAPDIFAIEVAHTLTKAERRGAIRPGEAGTFLLDVLSTSPRPVPYLPLLARAVEIASLARIGVYDCLYVALAEREGCAFITADDRLIRSLGAGFPFVVSLATTP